MLQISIHADVRRRYRIQIEVAVRAYAGDDTAFVHPDVAVAGVQSVADEVGAAGALEVHFALTLVQQVAQGHGGVCTADGGTGRQPILADAVVGVAIATVAQVVENLPGRQKHGDVAVVTAGVSNTAALASPLW